MFVVVFYLFGFLFRKSYHIPVNIALYRFYNRSLYGIFRLITKQITALYMMISGTFAMGPCVDGNVLLLEEISQYGLNSEIFWNNVLSIKWWGTIQIFLLVVTIIISIYKPWEKKKRNNLI